MRKRMLIGICGLSLLFLSSRAMADTTNQPQANVDKKVQVEIVAEPAAVDNVQIAEIATKAAVDNVQIAEIATKAAVQSDQNVINTITENAQDVADLSGQVGENNMRSQTNINAKANADNGPSCAVGKAMQANAKVSQVAEKVEITNALNVTDLSGREGNQLVTAISADINGPPRTVGNISI